MFCNKEVNIQFAPSRTDDIDVLIAFGAYIPAWPGRQRPGDQLWCFPGRRILALPTEMPGREQVNQLA